MGWSEIPILWELQQEDRTVCCGHTIVFRDHEYNEQNHLKVFPISTWSMERKSVTCKIEILDMKDFSSENVYPNMRKSAWKIIAMYVIAEYNLGPISIQHKLIFFAGPKLSKSIEESKIYSTPLQQRYSWAKRARHFTYNPTHNHRLTR